MAGTIADDIRAGAEQLPLTGAALVAAKQLDGLARGAPFSCSSLERNTLLGIAYSESLFDSRAIGDEGTRHGWFQMETGAGVSEVDQIEHAVRRVRAAFEQLSEQKLGKAHPFVEHSPSGMMKVVRASWQISERRLSEWVTQVRALVEGLFQKITADRHAQPGIYRGRTDEEVVEQLMAGGRNVDNFISWAGRKGARVDALNSGQEILNRFMEMYKWDPAKFITGEVRVTPPLLSGVGEQIPGAASDVVAAGAAAAGRVAARAIGALAGGLSTGLQSVLPYAGMALGGYMLYRLWRAARRRTVEVVEVES